MSFIVPDWREGTNYADPNIETNLSFWAWEFLRRRQAYRDDWAVYANCLLTVAKRIPQLDDHINHIIHGTAGHSPIDQHELFYELAGYAQELMHFSPARLDGEDEDTWVRRAAAMGARAYLEPMSVFLGKKYGLKMIVHPALSYWTKDESPRVQFENSARIVKQSVGQPQGSGDGVDHPLFGALLTLQFDLRSPDSALVDQLLAALKLQRRRIGGHSDVSPEKARPNGSLSNFNKYIRTLDALEVGALPGEIAAHLVGHKAGRQGKQDIANWTKTAVEFRDELCTKLPLYDKIYPSRKQ